MWDNQVRRHLEDRVQEESETEQVDNCDVVERTMVVSERLADMTLVSDMQHHTADMHYTQVQLLELEVHWDGPHTAKARSLQGEDMMLMELQNTALALKLCSEENMSVQDQLVDIQDQLVHIQDRLVDIQDLEVAQIL